MIYIIRLRTFRPVVFLLSYVNLPKPKFNFLYPRVTSLLIVQRGPAKTWRAHAINLFQTN
jgi:hypothetical protein